MAAWEREVLAMLPDLAGERPQMPLGAVSFCYAQAIMPEQNTRRFPPPWRVEQIPGGYKILDANGQPRDPCRDAVAYRADGWLAAWLPCVPCR